MRYRLNGSVLAVFKPFISSARTHRSSPTILLVQRTYVVKSRPLAKYQGMYAGRFLSLLMSSYHTSSGDVMKILLLQWMIMTFDTSEFPNGTYVVCLRVGDQTRYEVLCVNR